MWKRQVSAVIMNNYCRMSRSHAERCFLLLSKPPEDVKNGRIQKIAKEEMQRQLQRGGGVINNKQLERD